MFRSVYRTGLLIASLFMDSANTDETGNSHESSVSGLGEAEERHSDSFTASNTTTSSALRRQTPWFLYAVAAAAAVLPELEDTIRYFITEFLPEMVRYYETNPYSRSIMMGGGAIRELKIQVPEFLKLASTIRSNSYTSSVEEVTRLAILRGSIARNMAALIEIIPRRFGAMRGYLAMQLERFNNGTGFLFYRIAGANRDVTLFQTCKIYAREAAQNIETMIANMRSVSRAGGNNTNSFIGGPALFVLFRQYMGQLLAWAHGLVLTSGTSMAGISAIELTIPLAVVAVAASVGLVFANFSPNPEGNFLISPLPASNPESPWIENGLYFQGAMLYQERDLRRRINEDRFTRMSSDTTPDFACERFEDTGYYICE